MFRIILCAFMALLVPMAAHCADAEDTVLFDRYNPPYMYEDGGTARGLYPAIVRKAFERMGLPVTCRSVPWKRALDLSNQGKTAIGGLFMTEARQLIYDYSEPIYTERLMIFVNTANPFEFRNISSLTGKTVGVLHGWSYGDAFDKARAANQFKAIPVNTDLRNFEKLSQGRLDCVIATQISAQLVMKSGDYTMIRMIKPPMTINHTYIAFGKKAQKKALVDKFNATLRQMRESGEYQKLLKEHGVVMPTP